MKTFVTCLGLVGFFAAGFLLSRSSKKFPVEIASWTNTSRRDPASIKRSYDFSELEGNALSYAAKQRLLDGAEVVSNDKGVGVELGHFVIRGQDGKKEFACQRYSKVVMTFAGDGVAVAGELPKMEVEGACDISSDINRISALYIPVQRIIGEPVADGEFEFRDGQPITLRFANVSDEWPKTWMLEGIKLVDPSGKYTELDVQPAEIRDILKKPLTVNF
jgi:hypothetical protein